MHLSRQRAVFMTNLNEYVCHAHDVKYLQFIHFYTLVFCVFPSLPPLCSLSVSFLFSPFANFFLLLLILFWISVTFFLLSLYIAGILNDSLTHGDQWSLVLWELEVINLMVDGDRSSGGREEPQGCLCWHWREVKGRALSGDRDRCLKGRSFWQNTTNFYH